MSREKFLPDFHSDTRVSEDWSRNAHANRTGDIVERGRETDSLDSMRETEQGFAKKVHNALAELIRGVDTAFSKLPRALRLSVLSATLLHAETAMAQSFVDRNGNVDSPAFSEGEILTRDAKKTIAELQRQRVEVMIRNASTPPLGLSLYEIVNNRQISFSQDIETIYISRRISGAENIHFLNNFEGSRPEMHIQYSPSKNVSEVSFKTKDKFGNEFSVFRLMNRDGESFDEIIYISPAKIFTEESGTAVPLKIDTSFLEDLPDMSNIFNVKSHEMIVMVDDLPLVNNATSGMASEEVRALVAPHAQDIAEGIGRVIDAFSYDDLILKPLTVEGGSNASASKDLISLGLVRFDRSIPEGQRGKIIASTAEHEAFHVMDKQLQLSTSSPAFFDFFARTSPEILDGFSESEFNPDHSLQYDGHAADSPTEFFASVMNSINDPRWHERVGSLSVQEREAYKEVLGIIQEMLKNNPKLEKDAPIHEQLRVRLAYFE